MATTASGGGNFAFVNQHYPLRYLNEMQLETPTPTHSCLWSNFPLALPSVAVVPPPLALFGLPSLASHGHVAHVSTASTAAASFHPLFRHSSHVNHLSLQLPSWAPSDANASCWLTPAPIPSLVTLNRGQPMGQNDHFPACSSSSSTTTSTTLRSTAFQSSATHFASTLGSKNVAYPGFPAGSSSFGPRKVTHGNVNPKPAPGGSKSRGESRRPHPLADNANGNGSTGGVKDYSTPLTVDCSVEYDLSRVTRPPPGAQPLLMILPKRQLRRASTPSWRPLPNHHVRVNPSDHHHNPHARLATKLLSEEPHLPMAWIRDPYHHLHEDQRKAQTQQQYTMGTTGTRMSSPAWLIPQHQPQNPHLPLHLSSQNFGAPVSGSSVDSGRGTDSERSPTLSSNNNAMAAWGPLLAAAVAQSQHVTRNPSDSSAWRLILPVPHDSGCSYSSGSPATTSHFLAPDQVTHGCVMLQDMHQNRALSEPWLAINRPNSFWRY